MGRSEAEGKVTHNETNQLWVEESVWICFKAYQTWLQQWTYILLKAHIQKLLRHWNCISLQHNSYEKKLHTTSEEKRVIWEWHA